MDVKTLRYFLAVAREGSLTAASKTLFLTQPALSRQIRNLEDELGRQLFVRRGHRMELTSDGARLRDRAREIVELVEYTAEEMTRNDDAEVSGIVHIAANETRVVYEVARVADHVHAAHPGITFDLTTGDQDALEGILDKGLADFGVFMQPSDLSGYHTLRIPGRDVWGVVIRADHELAAKETVGPHDIRGLPAILSKQAINDELTLNEFASWLETDRKKIQVIATTDLTRNSLPFVMRGMGILFTIEGLAECSERTGLVFRPLSPPLTSKVDLAWKRHRSLSPAAAAFLAEAERLWQDVA